MANYSDADIAKIINECEILILPDDTTIEEVLASNDQTFSIKQNSAEAFNSRDADGSDCQLEQTEEEFEQIFQHSKVNKFRLPVSCKL